MDSGPLAQARTHRPRATRHLCRTVVGMTASADRSLRGYLVAMALCILSGAALSACGSAQDGVVPLAKVDGWRDGFDTSEFAVLEIAFDAETARRAWLENVPLDLAERSGDPLEPGKYGDLEDVNFEEQVVAVWSSGQSGSCPSWLAQVMVQQSGLVELERGSANPGEDCTSDYRTYRMVVAVDRSHVPHQEDLPIRDVAGVPDGLVSAYPAPR